MANTSDDIINKETDARFWSSTGYKPGHKLDLSNPTDKAMSKVWLDTQAKVKEEAAAGQLQKTHEHPVVQQAIETAAQAHQATVEHVEAAAQAPDAQTRRYHTEQATRHAQTVKNKMAEARAVQPATVSPVVVHAAATQAHVHARREMPTTTRYIPADHPGQRHRHWHPHPHAPWTMAIEPPEPEVIFVPILDPMTGQPTGETQQMPAPAAPPTAEDHVALQQAADAPATAASSFQGDGGAGGDAPPTTDLALAKQGAQTVASKLGLSTKEIVIGSIVLVGGGALVWMLAKGRR